MLATGGAGKVYLYTTNPDIATGDGVAMAWRAGCRVANMEFIQFHPTCLFHPYAEVVPDLRGGARRRRRAEAARRHALHAAHDERAELAPRDIVARAIDFEIKKRGVDCVYLDISHQPRCISARALPDDPRALPRVRHRHHEAADPGRAGRALHVRRRGDRSRGRARTWPGLYAVGETPAPACTARTGSRATRCSKASCSAARLRKRSRQTASQRGVHAPLPDWDESRVTDPDEEVVVAHNWDELRRLMWNYVGIVRTDKRLARAQHRLALLRDEIHEYYANFKVRRDLLELRNLVDVAALIVECARARHESRGLHYSRDWPETLPKALPTVLTPPVARRRQV